MDLGSSIVNFSIDIKISLCLPLPLKFKISYNLHFNSFFFHLLGQFNGIPNVFDFLFAYNQLTQIQAGTFSYTSAPSNIDVTGNQITSLEGGAFYDSKSFQGKCKTIQRLVIISLKSDADNLTQIA